MSSDETGAAWNATSTCKPCFTLVVMECGLTTGEVPTPPLGTGKERCASRGNRKQRIVTLNNGR